MTPCLGVTGRDHRRVGMTSTHPSTFCTWQDKGQARRSHAPRAMKPTIPRGMRTSTSPSVGQAPPHQDRHSARDLPYPLRQRRLSQQGRDQPRGNCASHGMLGSVRSRVLAPTDTSVHPARAVTKRRTVSSLPLSRGTARRGQVLPQTVRRSARGGGGGRRPSPLGHTVTQTH